MVGAVDAGNSAEPAFRVELSEADLQRAEELYGEFAVPSAEDGEAASKRKAALRRSSERLAEEASKTNHVRKLDLEPDFTPLALLDDL